MNELIKLKIDNVALEGNLILPQKATGLVIFSHGSGSSRFSPRNNFVAQHLHRRGLGTFLFDLLTREEDEIYSNRFNIELLSHRLIEATQTITKQPAYRKLSIGYFGASTGAASALVAAARLKSKIKAVVSRGGRPDLAMEHLYMVKTPTLLIIGELDHQVIGLNKEAYEQLNGIKNLKIIEGATHLFEEPGTLEEVAELSGDWFIKYLTIKKSVVI